MNQSKTQLPSTSSGQAEIHGKKSKYIYLHTEARKVRKITEFAKFAFSSLKFANLAKSVFKKIIQEDALSLRTILKSFNGG